MPSRTELNDAMSIKSLSINKTVTAKDKSTSFLLQRTNLFHNSYPEATMAIYHSTTHESSHVAKSIIDSPYSLVFPSEPHNDH